MVRTRAGLNQPTPVMSGVYSISSYGVHKEIRFADKSRAQGLLRMARDPVSRMDSDLVVDTLLAFRSEGNRRYLNLKVFKAARRLAREEGDTERAKRATKLIRKTWVDLIFSDIK